MEFYLRANRDGRDYCWYLYMSEKDAKDERNKIANIKDKEGKPIYSNVRLEKL
jgi:hypothetical protein